MFYCGQVCSVCFGQCVIWVVCVEVFLSQRWTRKSRWWWRCGFIHHLRQLLTLSSRRFAAEVPLRFQLKKSGGSGAKKRDKPKMDEVIMIWHLSCRYPLHDWIFSRGHNSSDALFVSFQMHLQYRDPSACWDERILKMRSARFSYEVYLFGSDCINF